MTDDELERRLRAHYQALNAGPVPATLPAQIEAALGRRRRRRPVSVLRLTALAAGLVAVLVVGVAVELRPGGFLGAPTIPPVPSASVASATPHLTNVPPGPTSTPSPSIGAAAVDQAGTFRGGGLWGTQGSTLLISSDAGASWRRSSIPTSASLLPAAFVLDAEHAWSITPGPGSTTSTGSPTDVLHFVVHRTTDGGQTWQASTVPGNYANTGPELVFADAEHGYLVASAERFSDGTSTVLRTDDGGATWTVTGTSPWLGSEVSVSDASTLWAGGQQEAGGQFLQPILDVSRDGGHTWVPVRLPGITGGTEAECGCFLDGPPLFLSPTTGYATVAAVPGTNIYRTSDGGQSWTLVAEPPVDAAAGLAVLDAGHWLLPVDNPFALDATADSGAIWHPLTTSGLSNGGWIVWIGALDNGHAAALVPVGNSYPAVSALYLTADGGVTWQPANLGGASPSASPTAVASLPPGGITIEHAEALAMASAPLDGHLVTAAAGQFGALSAGLCEGPGPCGAITPSRLVWAITYASTAVICGALGSPCESPRPGTVTVFLDYYTGAFLTSLGDFPNPN